jgi:hypothetical protein
MCLSLLQNRIWQGTSFFMKRSICTTLVFCLVSTILLGQKNSGGAVKSISRQERFAGLHLDFHAMLKDTAIGRTFTHSLIDSLLTIAKPDFIQVDCKGHYGISSYPTKVGHAPAHFDRDIMKIWREVTAKHKVPLYVHYSGIWDDRAVELHPEWARINAGGDRDKRAVSLLGDYPSRLLHPQLVELAKDYKLDGAWIDGDCWTLKPDYSPAVAAAFEKETGISKLPVKGTDPHYFEWMEFNRKLFRNYITDYVNAAHQANPDFKITSNWSFSSMMPEKVDVPVDFLSGDVAGSNSLYSSAFESRCLALQGKPWDLMSWSFAWKKDQKATKSVAQLKQEAAEVLAMGGGFQTYWQQNLDGTPEPYQFGKMGELIRFSNARREFCYEAKITPQIGLLFSTYEWKRKPMSGLYSAHSQEALKGSLNMLLDSQLPVEILMDHHLQGRINAYPLLILPEWEQIDPLQREELLTYVKNGGNLIITGAAAASAFAEPLGIDKSTELLKDTLIFAGLDDQILRLRTDFKRVNPLPGTQTVGSRYQEDDLRFREKDPLATIRQLGKGKIAGIYLDLGEFYIRNKNLLMPKLMKAVLAKMNVALLSTVHGSSNVHQVVARKNGKSYVHLINTSGPHDNPNVMVYDEVPALSNLTVQIRASATPRSVRLQPGNIPLKYRFEKEHILVTVPSTDIHSIVEITH